MRKLCCQYCKSKKKCDFMELHEAIVCDDCDDCQLSSCDKYKPNFVARIKVLLGIGLRWG